ncbi:MAG: hypothetical protein WA885_05490 [Phormidesmis sp.]
MTGSRPNPRFTSPKRRRAAKPTTPWRAIAALFVVYVLIGLILSVPMPPFWIWILAIVGSLLMILGLNPPGMPGKSSRLVGWLAYAGCFLLVIALAIATNYIGGGQTFDDLRFMVALVSLAALTLLAIVLAAAATIASAQASRGLMAVMTHRRSLTVVISTCLVGICLGGLAGLTTLLTTAGS